MGEFALYGSGRVKIGTCEDMYYLRWDQRALVAHDEGSVDVRDADQLKELRFRFPWPFEDGTTPGAFENAKKGVEVDLSCPPDVKHDTVQFSTPHGYLMSIPCPEGRDGKQLISALPHGVHKNGWRGDVLLVQQALRNGKLCPIFECGGCGEKFRIEDIDELKDMLAALRAERNGINGSHDEWRVQVADRIEAGLREPVTA